MSRKYNQGPYLALNRNGVWEIRWSENGRSRTRTTNQTDRAKANMALARFTLDGAQKEDRKISISRILELYFSGHVLRKVVDKDRERLIIRHLDGFFGHTAASAIRISHIEAYERHRAPARPGTIRRELATLVASLNHAVRHRHMARADIPYIPLPAAAVPRDRWLTRSEAARILRASAKNRQGGRLARVERFVWLALYTAARSGAIIELTWDRVDFDRGLIDFNPTGRRQTKKRRPVVPIAPELYPVLRRARREANSLFVLDNAGTVRTSFESLIKRTGIKTVTAHTFRHTWATWAAQDGVDLWMIGGVLGDRMATVEANYAHHHPDFLRSAMDRRKAQR